jgi:hypothetical protein
MMTEALRVPGFRYMLELPDRSPADPAMFNTALPPGMWKPGDTFIAASDLRQFRIVEIGELENPELEQIHGVWIVEPVERVPNQPPRPTRLASTTGPWRSRRRTRGRSG